MNKYLFALAHTNHCLPTFFTNTCIQLRCMRIRVHTNSRWLWLYAYKRAAGSRAVSHWL